MFLDIDDGRPMAIRVFPVYSLDHVLYQVDCLLICFQLGPGRNSDLDKHNLLLILWINLKKSLKSHQSFRNPFGIVNPVNSQAYNYFFS